ncbi:MAG: hypothetical protein HKP08_03705, partial [Flavobacteriaceae bacterium]|nr:hypothetical protein [Flavobacteriaceae bacterium]
MYAISYPDLPKNKSSQLILLIFLILSLATTSVLAQANTEVFLLTLKKTGDNIQLGPPKNISNNPGYDNQPSFYNDNLLLFSSTRNGQTDIAAYAANKDSVI